MNYCIADKNGRIYTDLIYCCENCWGWRGWKWEQDSTDKTNTALWDCKHGPIIAGFPSIVSASAVHSCRFWSTINGEIAMLTLKLVCLDLRNITASKGRRAVHTSCSSGPPPPRGCPKTWTELCLQYLSEVIFAGARDFIWEDWRPFSLPLNSGVPMPALKAV